MTAPRDQDDRAGGSRAIERSMPGARAPGIDLGPRAPDEPARLGEMQRGLWSVPARSASPAYNLCSAFRIRGPLDVATLQQAFASVVARHRLLRSTFKADGDTALQIVHDHVPLTIERIVAEERRRAGGGDQGDGSPFDLGSGRSSGCGWSRRLPGQ